MKIALLGTGFGQARAAVYAQRPNVDQVVVFGRTTEKLAKISGQFRFATTTTTDLDGLITDASVDLVDVCLPTRLHADVAVQAMQAGRPAASLRRSSSDITSGAGLFERRWRRPPVTADGAGTVRGPA